MSRRARATLVGVAVIAVSLVTMVLVPLVVAAVVTAWLVVDADIEQRRAPGWFGKIALALLAVVWAATATVVLVFEAHFSCGGTLGGFGESANARLDEACYDRRLVRRLPATLAVIAAGSAAIGVLLRRRVATASTVDEPEVSIGVGVVGGLVTVCVVGWTGLLAIAVVV